MRVTSKFSREFRRLPPINYKFSAAFLFNSLENSTACYLLLSPQYTNGNESERHKRLMYTKESPILLQN